MHNRLQTEQYSQWNCQTTYKKCLTIRLGLYFMSALAYHLEQSLLKPCARLFF